MQLTSTLTSARVCYALAAPTRLIARNYHRSPWNKSNVPYRPHRILSRQLDVIASPGGSLFARRRVSSQATSDPSRPDLFYHLVSLPHPVDPSVSTPAYALSFLSTPPPSGKSASIIGWLPAIAPGDITGDVEAGLNDFVENGGWDGFLQIL